MSALPACCAALDAAAPGFDARARGADRVRGGAGSGGRRRGRRDPRRRARARRRGACSSTRRASTGCDAPSVAALEITAARDARGVRRAAARRSATRSSTAAARVRAYHERQKLASWSYRRGRRQRARPAGDAARPRRRLRAGRQGGVSVVGADERDPRAGRRRAGDRHGRAHARRRAQSAGARRRAPGRRRRACSRSAARRRSRRSPTARRRFPRSTRSAVPATPTSRRPSAACSAPSASTWSPGVSEILVIADGSAQPGLGRDGPLLAGRARRARAGDPGLAGCGAARRGRGERAAAARGRCRGAAIIAASLADRGALIQVRDLDEACAVVNRIAPEHLELAVADPEALLPKIRHAGAIFMGHHASEALGDYCAGPNHVLPTGAHRALLVAARRLRFPEALERCSRSRRRRRGRSGRSRRRSRAARACRRTRGAREYRLDGDLTRGRAVRSARRRRQPGRAASIAAAVVRPEIRALTAYDVAKADGHDQARRDGESVSRCPRRCAREIAAAVADVRDQPLSGRRRATR